jgi:hypothetical protein
MTNSTLTVRVAVTVGMAVAVGVAVTVVHVERRRSCRRVGAIRWNVVAVTA